MSEMTVVQLVVSQREKELRAQRKPGLSDWFEMPCVYAIGACLLVFAIVAAAAGVILAPFRRYAAKTKDQPTGQP